MKLAYFTFSILILLFYAFMNSCKSNHQKSPPVTPSNVVNNFVRSAPIQFLNIDEVEKNKITLGKENIIYGVHHEVSKEEPIVGDIWDAIKVDNQFYVYDFTSKAIFSITTRGKIKGPLSRDGRGPGEHKGVGVLKVNSDYLYATDVNNGRINRYSLNMEEVFPSLQMRESSGIIDLNNEIMLFENKTDQSENGLLFITSIDNTEDTLTTLMPRIVPIGFEPSLYNNLLFSVNNSGQVIASYIAFPWIFVFNEDFQHTQTLIIESVGFDSLNIPELILEKKPTSKRYSLHRPFVYHKLMNNGDIFIGIEDELIHLVLTDKGEYEMRRIQFEQFDGLAQASIMVIASTNDTVYAKNSQYLYEFLLP